MGTLVLGDIHGRNCWKGIIEKETPDLVIFLGDYVTTHQLISEQDQFDNFIEILAYKEENSDKVILLRGNHDCWNFSWGDCYPYPSQKLLIKLIPEFNRFNRLSQWIYIQDNILFSHAGVSKMWLNNNGLTLEDINNQDWNERFRFTPDNYADNSGTSNSQPPTWIRPQNLVTCAVDNYIQVVGHTPVSNIHDIHDQNYRFPHIWLCDNLPQYLIIDNDKFIIKTYGE